MADAIIRPAPKRRRRWPRILGRIFLALIILLVVVYFVGTSSAVFKGVILPKVGKAMNATITVSSASAECLTASEYSHCSASSGVDISSSVIPRMPFKGVRISWLMVARNRLFSSVTSLAVASALASSSFLRVSSCA